MIIFLILTHLLKGAPVDLALGHSCFIIYPIVLFNLIMVGVFAGIFVIPLRVCQQEKTKTEERGKILACANFFTFSGILLSGIVTYLLTGKSNISDSVIMSKAATFLNNIMFNFTPGTVLIIIAVFTFIISVYAIIIHFEYFYRAVAVFLTRIVYRVTSIGETNIPEKEAAVLVSNHVSFLDTFLISSCTSRKIHFVIHKDYYKYFILRHFYKYCGFIQYPEKDEDYDAFYERINKILDDNEVVCIFPEGRLTRNGLTGEFKIDVNSVLKGKDVPVIPAYLGNLWGSTFSYYYGKIRIRIPEKFSHAVKISFGKPTNKLSNFEIRQRITELSAEAEALPGKDEQVLHTRVAKLAKRYPFQKKLC